MIRALKGASCSSSGQLSAALRALVEAAREIEAQRTGVYHATPDATGIRRAVLRS
jgi:hypothetical protein